MRWLGIQSLDTELVRSNAAIRERGKHHVLLSSLRLSELRSYWLGFFPYFLWTPRAPQECLYTRSLQLSPSSWPRDHSGRRATSSGHYPTGTCIVFSLHISSLSVRSLDEFSPAVVLLPVLLSLRLRDSLPIPKMLSAISGLYLRLTTRPH